MFVVSISERRNIQSADILAEQCRKLALERKRIQSAQSSAYFLDMDARKLPPPVTFQSDTQRSAWQKNKNEESNLNKIKEHIHLQKGVNAKIRNKEKQFVRIKSAKFQRRVELEKRAIEMECAKLLPEKKEGHREDEKGENTDNKVEHLNSTKAVVFDSGYNSKKAVSSVKCKQIKHLSKKAQRGTISSSSLKSLLIEDADSDYSINQCSSPETLDNDIIFKRQNSSLSFHRIGSFYNCDTSNATTDEVGETITTKKQRPHTVNVSSNKMVKNKLLYKPRPKTCIPTSLASRASNLNKLRADLKQMQVQRMKVKQEVPTVHFYLCSERERTRMTQTKVDEFCETIKAMKGSSYTKWDLIDLEKKLNLK